MGGLENINWWPVIGVMIISWVFMRMMRAKHENKLRNPVEYMDFITLTMRIWKCDLYALFKEAGSETGFNLHDSKIKMDIGTYLKSRGKEVPHYVKTYIDSHKEDLLELAKYQYEYDGEASS